jgi:hypothetical protein
MDMASSQTSHFSLDQHDQDDALDHLVKQVLTRHQKLILPRYGVIKSGHGQLLSITSRVLPKIATNLHCWWDTHFRSLPQDTCWLYFSRPIRCPGFISINYARTGRHTRLATVLATRDALHSIARLANAQAIVCHSIHPRMNVRVLNRLGYERHAESLPGLHFIKRFSQPALRSST